MDKKVALSNFVSEQNIHRYERMLKTKLTDLERTFIEKRIAEERLTLQRNRSNLTLKGIGAAILSSELLLLDFALVNQVALL